MVRASTITITIAAFACACRMGLPPEPPEHDASNADANVPAYQPTTNVFETSAFEGVKLQGGGHDHHGHGGQAKPPGEHESHDEAPQAEGEHEGHGDTVKGEGTPSGAESSDKPKRKGAR